MQHKIYGYNRKTGTGYQQYNNVVNLIMKCIFSVNLTIL